MKKILSIAMCIALAAVTTRVAAQQDGRNENRGERREQQASPANTPEEMAKNMADRMKEQLNLTDDQHAKVLDLQLAFIKERGNMSREEMEKLTDEQRKERREEMTKKREEYDAKLKKILTADQYTKYEEMRRNAPRGFGQGGNAPERRNGGNN